MQKWIVLLFACLLYQQYAFTQANISGKITDSLTKDALPYATVSVSAGKENKVVNGATTDSVGVFTITGVSNGNYTLTFESIGYTKKVMNGLRVDKGRAAYNLGVITLHKSENTLQGVVVTSQKKLIENRIDKMVFNAENDISSQGGVATDVLKKIPLVSVDADGNVELAGNTGIRFLINGKPSTAFGSNIADVLQSIPASEIKSIEVITNPGARYDAEGMGGIINIILKKSRVNGINGNLSLTAGTRLENGSFNVMARHGNFGLNAFASGNARLASTITTALHRTTTDSVDKAYDILTQQGNPRSSRYGAQSGLGFDWTANKYNSLSGSINYESYGHQGNGLVNQLQQSIPFAYDTASSVINSVNHYNEKDFSYTTDANINYKRTFKKEDQSLEINVNTSLSRGNTRSNTYQALLPQDSVYYGVNNNNLDKQDEYEIEIDYTQPLTKKITFDAGADITFDDILSHSNVYGLQPASKLYLYDTSVSNYLSYHQKVYAAYAEISLPVGKWFDAKLGSRYERTEINSYYSNAATQVAVPGYNTLVPSAYILRKLTERQTLKLSYSKRIGRPEYDDLNPFINTTDPKNISSGNPYLRPEIGNRIELAYNHDYGDAGSFMITASYRESNHDIQPYTAYYTALQLGDSVYNNVSVNTMANIGLEENAGISFFGNYKATDKLTMRTNLYGFRRHINNGIDTGLNPTSYNYRININLTYLFTKTLSAEFFGNFNSARHELQGRYPSFSSYTIAARKQFWNKKASLAITANSLFNKYLNQETVLYGTNFTTSSYRKVPFRSIGINFTWKFGKLDFKKDKDDKEGSPATGDGG